MNKIILVCLVVFSLNAQSQVKIYAKSGINLSFISIDNRSNSIKPGLHIGGGAAIHIKNKYGIMAELLYSQKGSIDKHGPTDLTTSLDYISVPLLFYYSVSEKLNVHIGPELSFLIKGKAKSVSSGMDVTDIYEKFDKGLALGAGYKLGKLGINLRMIKGFKGIIEVFRSTPAGNDYGRDKTGSNNTLQFGLSYFFN